MAAEASWKKLAAELVEHGVDSEYLARVVARVTVDFARAPEGALRQQQLETIELEIMQEMAGALGRSEDRVNLALAELQLMHARFVRACREPAPRAQLVSLVDAYNAQRLVAQARVRELLIHREAVGFRRNQILSELYPVPAPLELGSEVGG